MVFSTIIFLFRFLPITLALYYLAPAKLKNTVLFLCSLVFYCWGEVRFLPLGISFYTFQTLSYSIDVYRRDVKAERNIIDFGAYVVMFPQLIAGPIVKYRDVSDQLHVYRHRYNLKQIEEGMTLFTFGLAKKVLLADAVGALWTDIIGVADSPSTTFVGLAAVLRFLRLLPHGHRHGQDAGLRLPRKLQLPLYLRFHH